MTGCLAPVIAKKEELKDSRGFETFLFPCGKCVNCRKRKSGHWAFRLEQELKHSSSAAFLTLTYNDENLHYTENGNQTLNPEDHVRFIKKARKLREVYQQSKKGRLKYYCVGEYGTFTHRPHYHYIIFNLPNDWLTHPDIIQNIWNRGHIRVDPVNGATIRYVTDYVLKKNDEVGNHHLDDRKPEFSRMSKGLGACYLTPEVKKYYQSLEIPYIRYHDGKKLSMPRYYKDSIYSKEARGRINAGIIKHQEEQGNLEPRQELEIVKHKFFQSDINKRRKRDKI